MQLQHIHIHLALLLCFYSFHLFTFMLSVFPSLLGIIFYFFFQTRFSVPLLFPFSSPQSCLPSFHGFCEFCFVSHKGTFIYAHKRSLSFSVFWTQTVDHALIYFSSLLFLPLCFSLLPRMSFLFFPAPPPLL